jgi:hypothetical protein
LNDGTEQENNEAKRRCKKLEQEIGIIYYSLAVDGDLTKVATNNAKGTIDRANSRK